jgi:hypothetical protein
VLQRTLIVCAVNMRAVHSVISVVLLSLMFVFMYAQDDTKHRTQNPPFQPPPFNVAQKGRQGRRSARIKETESTSPSEGTPDLNIQRARHNNSVVRLP